MKILFVSLGCDKNLVDSEKMTALLMDAGFEMTDDEMQADAAVVNTCCFIHDSKQESVETILRLAELKKTASLRYLLITGCLAERYRQDILDEIPEVDVVLGTTAYDELASALKQLSAGSRCDRLILKAPELMPLAEGRRALSDISHYSYLKIAEGCDKHCTYCVIPSVKGRYRSIALEQLVREAGELAASGINELTVIAQETTLYGTDLYGHKCLPELLHRLCAIEGLKWIRLMYCYPEEIDDELIKVFKEEPKLCKYIDLPIQHASDRILKAMGRRTNRAQIEDIIGRLRTVPGMVIRTSLITGFPGETDEDHEIMKAFLSEMKLDRVGVFTYSREENTPAYRMKGQIPAAVKRRRRKELMLLQQQLVFERNASRVGSLMQVIIDGRLPEDGVYVGRTYMDAPDIDGCVFVNSDRELMSGSIISCRITAYKDYDLVGSEESVSDS